ncbi:MAG TPA: NADH:flavin oxidoreductase [Polyangia bacterium]|jgi:2,4-dienoyl-CoA reductase-like NADH-dependent reductase (Old Yellow Enzyme family)
MAHLFEPFTQRGLTLRSRIVFPPMAQDLCTTDGEVTDRLLAHYRARARPGLGLLMIEHSYVERRGRYSPRQTGIHEDALVPGLKRLTDALHQHGVPVGIQLAHAGARACAAQNGAPAVAPSAVAPPGATDVPRALAEAELFDLKNRFVAAALRAVEAGVDVIELHGAHGFLLSEFFSPLTNRRADGYGGDLRGRRRLAVEIVTAVRGVIGERALWFRLGADDRLPGGLTLAEGGEIGRALVAAGVDVLDVSGGLCGSRPADLGGAGFFGYAAAAVRAAAGAPVVAVGGLQDPRDADRLVRSGAADLVAVGRAILKDPEWPERAAAVLGATLPCPA